MKKAIISVIVLSVFFVGISLADNTEADIDINSPAVGKSKFPLTLTALDFITKIYGMESPDSARDCILSRVVHSSGINPRQDQSEYRLGPDSGYSVNYYGQQPDVEAIAKFDGDSVEYYGFFFIFPYDAGKRYKAMVEQVLFCTTLLQEIYDIGMQTVAYTNTDGIFETQSSYQGKDITLKLIEETRQPQSSEFKNIGIQLIADKKSLPDLPGRFVISMTIIP